MRGSAKPPTKFEIERDRLEKRMGAWGFRGLHRKAKYAQNVGIQIKCAQKPPPPPPPPNQRARSQRGRSREVDTERENSSFRPFAL